MGIFIFIILCVGFILAFLPSVIDFFRFKGSYGLKMIEDDAQTTYGLKINAIEDVELRSDEIKKLAVFAGNDNIFAKFHDKKNFAMLVVGGTRIIFYTTDHEIQVLGLSVSEGMGKSLQDALDHLEHAAKKTGKKVRFFCSGLSGLRKILLKHRGYSKTGNRSELTKRP